MSARMFVCLASAAMLLSPLAQAAPPKLESGKVTLESIGPMTFATGGILLVGDPKTATVYAIDTQDSPGGSGTQSIDDIGKAVASTIGADKVQVGELAVNPETGNAFVTVSVSGDVRLIKVDGENTITALNLDDIGHAKKALPNPPPDREFVRRGRSRNPRDQSITDIAFFDGKVMVTGMSAGDSPSKVMEFEFPFGENSIATSVEIFHAAHGRMEDTATIRTFLPIVIDGKPSLLAGFTCTPLVRFPVAKLDGEEKVRGTTVAELGNRNTPLDMIVYEKNGELSILMSNTARGVMKITTDGIGERETLSEKVSGGGTAGQPFETIESLSNVRQMDKLDDSRALALVESGGSVALKAIALP